jgi:6-phosphofructokinase 1
MVMRRIAVLTSGGDAPGMNAAVRAVVRAGVSEGFEIFGIRNGYAGLIRDDLLPLGCRDVGGIIERGGTFLGTSRCEEMHREGGQEAAVSVLRARKIDGLVVIGGNGSQAGALALSRRGFPVVGVASTIDNDLPGTDISIGATTAIEIAVEAIDRLRVTASSHRRAFLVEVMGRHCGYLALLAGIASGAEATVIPEAPIQPEELAHELIAAEGRGKRHAIVVVSEGARRNVDEIAEWFARHHERLGFELRVTRLGHIQRGGSPCVFDRMIATELGAEAVNQFALGNGGVLVGLHHNRPSVSPLTTALEKKQLDLRLLALAKTMSI